jgi:hypothetical protein
VSSLGVVSNGVVGLESDPLGQGSVLSGGLGQLGLGLEGLETLGLVLSNASASWPPCAQCRASAVAWSGSTPAWRICHRTFSGSTSLTVCQNYGQSYVDRSYSGNAGAAGAAGTDYPDLRHHSYHHHCHNCHHNSDRTEEAAGSQGTRWKTAGTGSETDTGSGTDTGSESGTGFVTGSCHHNRHTERHQSWHGQRCSHPGSGCYTGPGPGCRTVSTPVAKNCCCSCCGAEVKLW